MLDQRKDKNVSKLSAGRLADLKESLSDEDSSRLNRYIEQADSDIAALKETMFDLAEQVLTAHHENAFTGVIVEDSSARFLGRFVWKVLDPDKNLPLSLARPNTVRKSWMDSDNGADRISNHSFVQHGDIWSAGDNPLVVSEFSRSGNDLKGLCHFLRQEDRSPNLAILSTNDKWLPEDLKQYASRVIVADKGEKQLGFTYMHDNKVLNGVTKRTPDMNDDLPANMNRESMVLETWTQLEDGENPVVKKLAMNYVNKSLNNLVDEF